MQYAYESWDHEALPEEPLNLGASNDVQESSFSFSEDLKELEARLSLGLEEGMNAYKTQTANQTASIPPPTRLTDIPWNEFSRVVANEVLTYLLNNPLQTELTNLRSRLNEYYEDNRTLIQQSQQLVAENERLRKSLERSEKELSRYHPLAGRFFIKD